MNCKDCLYSYVSKHYTKPGNIEEATDYIQCRRYPPTNGGEIAVSLSSFPIVHEEYFCYEFARSDQ